MLRPIVILFSVLCLCACSGARLDGVSDDLAKIQFGAGGGFSGEQTSYVLLEDRRLFIAGQDSLRLVRRCNRKDVKRIFEEASTLEPETVNTPGNRWYRLTYFQEQDTLTAVWGDPTAITPTKLNQLWKDLMDLTKLDSE